MGVNITTIAYLRVLIIEIGSTIILMVEAQGYSIYIYIHYNLYIHFECIILQPMYIQHFYHLRPHASGSTWDRNAPLTPPQST